MSRETKTEIKERANEILLRLKRAYPEAQMILEYSTNWELLVAVMLSAQSTDLQVNKVTKKLFKKYKTLDDYVQADVKEFEQDIYSTGFYRQKAKHVLAAARMLKDRFEGEVPKTIAELTQLPGVARKTANIVLGNAYGIVEGIAVDTHVRRLALRLGFTQTQNTDKIEQDLMVLFPRSEWFRLTYYLIDHGRAICTAKKPKCNACPVQEYCPSAFQFPHFKKSNYVKK